MGFFCFLCKFFNIVRHRWCAIKFLTVEGFVICILRLEQQICLAIFLHVNPAYFSGKVRLLQQYQPCPETFGNANFCEPLSVSKGIFSQPCCKYRQAIRVCLKSAFAVTRQQTLFDVRLSKQSTNFTFAQVKCRSCCISWS